MYSQKNNPPPPTVLTPISPPIEDQQEHLSGGRATITQNHQNWANLPQNNPYFLPSIQANDFLPPISRWTTLGGLLLISAVAVTIALTSVIKYKVTVKAQAVIRPAGELRIVQATTDGLVIKISVQENQFLKKGDIIAILDDSQLQTKKSQLENSIQQTQLQQIQIKAQIQAIDSQIAAETDRSQRAIASAKAELSYRQREYQNKQITTDAEIQEAEANIKQAQEELQREQAELQSIEANLKSAQASFQAAKSKRDRYYTVFQAGALAQEQLEEAELAVEQQKQAVESQKAAFTAQKQTIEQQKQVLEVAKARWQKTKAGLNPSHAEVDIALESIAQEKASGEVTLAILNKERNAIMQQSISLSQKLEQDTRELQQVEIDLSKTIITATTDGVISHLNLRNSGQTVATGAEIAQIVPTDAPLKVKAAVSPKDIGKLAEGQNVQMRVSACPYPDYGTLKGVVSHISKDTIKYQENDLKTNLFPSPNQKGDVNPNFYEATIEPSSLFLQSGKNQCAIQLGMEGRVDIISREETVLQFLLRKMTIVF